MGTEGQKGQRNSENRGTVRTEEQRDKGIAGTEEEWDQLHWDIGYHIR